jgi:hypothetical protein
MLWHVRGAMPLPIPPPPPLFLTSTLNTCNIPLKQLKHLKHTLATCDVSRCGLLHRLQPIAAAVAGGEAGGFCTRTQHFSLSRRRLLALSGTRTRVVPSVASWWPRMRSLRVGAAVLVPLGGTGDGAGATPREVRWAWGLEWGRWWW